MNFDEFNDLKKLANVYSKNKTFVFVEEIIGQNKTYYNGYILKVKEDFILFLDVGINKEFPILIETIGLMKPSKKEERR